MNESQLHAKKKVFVGLSGGVDSSVSAYLLKEAGYDVTGIFIKVWQPDFLPCTWREDRLDAMRVAAHLGIPFKTLDLEKEYKKGVVDYLVAEYQAGRTPNPDVMCNKEVKFGAFLRWAKSEGADYIATGHYAQVKTHDGAYNLLRGRDPLKDQAYFLWTLQKEDLASILFPVGGKKKTEVREIAKRAGLPTFAKKDSQGICFIGSISMKDFLRLFIDTKPGDVLDMRGMVIGRHDGALLYTIGERHGFRIVIGDSATKPHYVVSKDIEKNTITVSEDTPGFAHPVSSIVLEHCFFRSEPTRGTSYLAEVRYHGKALPITITEKSGSEITIHFESPIYVAPGQSVVIYSGEVCIGGGIAR